MNVRPKTGKQARRSPGWRGLRRVAALLAVIAALWTGPLAAQTSPTVAASLQDSVIDVNEGTQYQISIFNGSGDNPPAPPVVAGLVFQYVSQESVDHRMFDSRSGWRTINSLVYTYTLRAMRPGRYVIPGQEVTVGGVALRTTALTLTVEGNDANGAKPPGQTVTSEFIVPHKSAYIGESVPVEVRDYFGLEVAGHPDPDPVLNGEGFSVQKFTAPFISPQTRDGFRYNAASYRSAIAGLKIGTLTVGPAVTVPVVRLPVSPSRRRRSNGGFDPFSIFGGVTLSQEQRLKVESDPVVLEIKALPSGKPADFSGAIGQFKLDVEAEPRRAQAGDPVTVHLLLSGQGNFERINPPALSDEHGLKTYPPSAKFKADDDVGLSGVKTFEQVVIADGARNSLPPYRFSYLDPATGKYVSLDTPPVAVRIEGSIATPAPTSAALPQANAAPTATPAPTPARAAEDILYIRTDPGVAGDRSSFLPVYQRRDFWLVQGAGLAMLLAAAGAFAWRARARNEAVRQQARSQREQTELQRALQKENTSRRDFYLAATRLAQLRAARGRANPPQTPAEISQARQLDPQTATSVQEIFHRHDELAYSGGRVAQEPVPADERRGVLATLETLGKNGK